MLRFLILVFILLLAPHQSYAACSKEDISFYLEKGFTQEQITQLCASSGSASEVPDYQPYQQKIIIYTNEESPGIKDGFTREEREAIKSLELGSDVRELLIDQNHIKFVSQVCLAVQEGKEVDQRFKICPDVNVEIARVGLSVKASGDKFGLFGQKMVVVEGNIKRTLKKGSDDFPAKFKQKLLDSYKWKTSKPVMSIPIRGDYSVTKLYDALTVLSKVPDDGTTLAQNEEDKEDEVKPETSTGEPEKKKRWWNPFD